MFRSTICKSLNAEHVKTKSTCNVLQTVSMLNQGRCSQITKQMPYKSYALSQHPQLDHIRDALHAGQSPREVASWCFPVVSHGTIWKFQKEDVEPLRRQIMESIDRFVREHGELPVLASDDDIHRVELEHDEWLRELVEFKEKRIRPALEQARRKAALVSAQEERSSA